MMHGHPLLLKSQALSPKPHTPRTSIQFKAYKEFRGSGFLGVEVYRVAQRQRGFKIDR